MSNDDRKDLPPVNSANFLEKLREAVQTYMGTRGDKLDRGLTVRDMADAGLAKINPRYLASSGRVPPLDGAGSAITDAYEPDLTPPPTPSGFTVSAAISNIFIEHAAPTYTQGHGHAKTVVYGATWISGALPVFANAVPITEFSGTVFAHPSNPATTWHLWIKWMSVDGVESTVPAGGTNGLVATTGQDVSLLLDALSGEITAGQLHSALGSRINLIDAAGTGLVTGLAANNAAISAINATLADISVTPDYDNAADYVLDDLVKYGGGLYQALGATTGNLPTNAAYWAKIGDYASLGDAVAGHAAILSDHETRVTASEGGLTSVAGRATVLEAAVNSGTTGLATKASVGYVDTAKADAISAGASSMAIVQARLNSGGDVSKAINAAQGGADTATYNAATAQSTANAAVTASSANAGSISAVQARLDSGDYAAVKVESSASASSVTGLLAQYTVKLDVNGKVSGYGLASSGPTGAGSAFEVRADKFSIAAETGAAAGFVPFTVLTAPTMIGGVELPAGAYASKAFIQDLQVTTAKIANLAVDDAKIASLSAAKINAGTLDAARIATGSLDAKIANLDTAVITSGFINAARINTASIASANIGAAQITSGFIDSARINTASIANVLIGTAQIASAAVTTANIGDLQVNTLQIANNAVTVPMSATGVDINNMTSTWVSSATVTGDFRGSGVVLSISAISDWTSVIATGANEVDWRLLRDGIELSMWRGLAQQNSAHSLCSMFSDTPSTGSHSYKVQFRTSASSGATYWIRTPTIVAIGYRK